MIVSPSGLKFAAVAALAAVLASSTTAAQAAGNNFAVGAQYDTTHVYVPVDDVDSFAASFIATFGGTSTKQIVATVTPTPSSTTSQLIQTPTGTVSFSASRRQFPTPSAVSGPDIS